MLKFICLFIFILLSTSLFAKEQTDFIMLANSPINHALKSPLIFHNSYLQESYMVLVFQKDQRNLDHPDLYLIRTTEKFQVVLYAPHAKSEHFKRILHELKKVPVTSYNPIQLIMPTAHAECMAPQTLNAELESVQQFSESASTTDQILACLSGVMQGVWDATGGLVSDVASFAYDLVTSPIDTAKKTYDQFQNMLNMISNIDETWHSFQKMFSQLPAEAKTHMICSFIGSLGTDALIAILTLGAGAPKLLVSFTNYLKRFSKLEKMLSLMKYEKFATVFPKTFLSKMAKGQVADKVLDRIELFAKHDMKDLAKSAVACAL
jgi:hypothetical protein